MPGFNIDDSLKVLYAVAGVGFLVLFAVRADQLDAYWMATIGGMLGLTATVFGGSSAKKDRDSDGDS